MRRPRPAASAQAQRRHASSGPDARRTAGISAGPQEDSCSVCMAEIAGCNPRYCALTTRNPSISTLVLDSLSTLVSHRLPPIGNNLLQRLVFKYLFAAGIDHDRVEPERRSAPAIICVPVNLSAVPSIATISGMGDVLRLADCQQFSSRVPIPRAPRSRARSATPGQ
jgi:hypothetical protein